MFANPSQMKRSFSLAYATNTTLLKSLIEFGRTFQFRLLLFSNQRLSIDWIDKLVHVMKQSVKLRYFQFSIKNSLNFTDTFVSCSKYDNELLMHLAHLLMRLSTIHR